MRKLLLVSGLVAASGCAPVEQGIALVEGVLKVTAPTCTTVATSREFVPSMLVDIGGAEGAAQNLTVPLKVRTTLQEPAATGGGAQSSFVQYGIANSSGIAFRESEVVFTTNDDNDDPALTVPGLPVSEDTKRVTGVSGIVLNQTAGAVGALNDALIFATILTDVDIELLRSDPRVSEQLTAANGAGALSSTYRVFANIRLNGITTGGAPVRSSSLAFPIDLCDGCLGAPPSCPFDDDEDPETPDVQAAPIVNPESCFRGAEVPSFVCPDAT